MTLIQFVLLLIVAGICGGLAQSLVGYSRGGCLVSIVLGFIGAVLGTWLQQKAGLPELFSIQFGNDRYPIIWSIIGAALFVAVINLISGRSRRGR